MLWGREKLMEEGEINGFINILRYYNMVILQYRIILILNFKKKH